jgi:hypothetical protein
MTTGSQLARCPPRPKARYIDEVDIAIHDVRMLERLIERNLRILELMTAGWKPEPHVAVRCDVEPPPAAGASASQHAC